MMAAFVDDVLALVLFVVLENVASGDLDASVVVLPLVYSVVFLAAGAVLAYYAFPPAVTWVLTRFKDDPRALIQPRQVKDKDDDHDDDDDDGGDGDND